MLGACVLAGGRATGCFAVAEMSCVADESVRELPSSWPDYCRLCVELTLALIDFVIPKSVV